MPSESENLDTAQANLASQYASESSGAKPNYSVDGQSIQHDSHRMSLLDEAIKARKLQREIQGPFAKSMRGSI